MIAVSLAANCPETGALVFPVAKDGLTGTAFPGLSPENVSLIRAAGTAHRFDGESGSINDFFVTNDGKARRILIAGTGQGTVEDFEKLGAAIVTRLLTSGETEVAIDLSALVIKPSAESVARLAAGIVLRGWRYDAYRTG